MSRLVKIASWQGKSRGSVVFVHGFGGHAYDTWRYAADDTFWPLWLAQDVEGLTVYSLAYEAPFSNWLGTSMPLQDRAINIFEVLLTEPGLRTGPIIFVCHSLGGLVVKKVMLNLQQQATRRPEANDLLERVARIVFAATPHTGAAHATWLERLSFLAWPSTIARILVANDPSLRDINVAYRGLAFDRRNVLSHQTYFETRDTAAGGIVDEASADPGLHGAPPVPIDADHISIVKPRDRASLLYARVRQFVELVPAVGDSGQLKLFALPPLISDQPLNIGPKFIRIAALCLVALIVFKGVQALVSPKVEVGEIQGPLVDQLMEKDRQIAKLLALLDDKRTTPALPGAEQELKKAVTAIDEGAGLDPRYASALDFLKAGKPSEAEPLLKAVAEEKAKSADGKLKMAVEERKDAAAAYRNLASIAAVSEPGRAREYYAKAAQLDPDNVEGAYWNGTYQLQAGKLDVAQEAYERVAKTARPSDARWLVKAQNGLGDIFKLRGNLSKALKMYADTLAIVDNLTKSDPENADWQRELALSFGKYGDVQKARGDLFGALKSYRDSLSIREKLANSNPSDTDRQRDLSTGYDRIGDVEALQGDLLASLKTFHNSLAIREKLAKSNPSNADWQLALSLSFDRIGDMKLAQQDLAGALASYNDSRFIREKLTKVDPENAVWQRALTVSLEKIGDVQTVQGDLSAAISSYSVSLKIRANLAKSDPGNATAQRDLAITMNKIADGNKTQGDLEGALKSYTDSLAIRKTLAKSDPSDPGSQRGLLLAFTRIGDVKVAQGDLAGALKNFRDGAAIAEKLAQSNLNNAGWQRDQSISLDRIGDVQKMRELLPV